MKDKDSDKIFENYTASVDTGQHTSASKWPDLISNWKNENIDWSKLSDDIKVDEFKRWVRDQLASRPGGNTVQTDLPNDDELKEMI